MTEKRTIDIAESQTDQNIYSVEMICNASPGCWGLSWVAGMSGTKEDLLELAAAIQEYFSDERHENRY